MARCYLNDSSDESKYACYEQCKMRKGEDHCNKHYLKTCRAEPCIPQPPRTGRSNSQSSEPPPSSGGGSNSESSYGGPGVNEESRHRKADQQDAGPNTSNKGPKPESDHSNQESPPKDPPKTEQEKEEPKRTQDAPKPESANTTSNDNPEPNTPPQASNSTDESKPAEDVPQTEPTNATSSNNAEPTAPPTAEEPKPAEDVSKPEPAITPNNISETSNAMNASTGEPMPAQDIPETKHPEEPEVQSSSEPSGPPLINPVNTSLPVPQPTSPPVTNTPRVPFIDHSSPWDRTRGINSKLQPPSNGFIPSPPPPPTHEATEKGWGERLWSWVDNLGIVGSFLGWSVLPDTTPRSKAEKCISEELLYDHNSIESLAKDCEISLNTVAKIVAEQATSNTRTCIVDADTSGSVNSANMPDLCDTTALIVNAVLLDSLPPIKLVCLSYVFKNREVKSANTQYQTIVDHAVIECKVSAATAGVFARNIHLQPADATRSCINSEHNLHEGLESLADKCKTSPIVAANIIARQVDRPTKACIKDAEEKGNTHLIKMPDVCKTTAVNVHAVLLDGLSIKKQHCLISAFKSYNSERTKNQTPAKYAAGKCKLSNGVVEAFVHNMVNLYDCIKVRHDKYNESVEHIASYCNMSIETTEQVIRGELAKSGDIGDSL